MDKRVSETTAYICELEKEVDRLTKLYEEAVGATNSVAAMNGSLVAERLQLLAALNEAATLGLGSEWLEKWLRLPDSASEERK